MKIRKILALAVFWGGMISSLVNGTVVKAEEKETLESYVEKELQGYLAGFGHNKSDEIEISQGYEVAGAEEEEYAYFIFDDEEMVGDIMVSEIDGEYVSCFHYGKIDEIQEAYDNPDEEIAIAKTEKDTVVYSSEAEEAVSISGENVGKRINLTKNDIDIVKKKNKEYLVIDTDNEREEKDGISLDEISDKKKVKRMVENEVEEATYSTVVYSDVTQVQTLRKREFFAEKRENNSKTKNYIFRPVEFVKNSTVTRDGEERGICWAASGASIIKYHTYNPFLTARGVFFALEEEYEDVPKGNVKWYPRMWRLYNLGMSYNNHKFSSDEVYAALKKDRPIFCQFRYYARINGTVRFITAHAVVLCGAYYYNSKLYYVYMDPNTADDDKYVVNSVVTGTDSTVGYSFVYYNGTSAFNNWVGVYW